MDVQGDMSQAAHSLGQFPGLDQTAANTRVSDQLQEVCIFSPYTINIFSQGQGHDIIFQQGGTLELAGQQRCDGRIAETCEVGGL